MPNVTWKQQAQAAGLPAEVALRSWCQQTQAGEALSPGGGSGGRRVQQSLGGRWWATARSPGAAAAGGLALPLAPEQVTCMPVRCPTAVKGTLTVLVTIIGSRLTAC